MVNSTSPILILTGMHRSGTSLTASLLQSAGVDIGKKLNPPTKGNIKGHFEDLAVVRFHENVLEANGLPSAGWVKLQKVTNIPEPWLTKAEEIISAKREATGITGWKDPRGTLFLDFWESRLPEAKYIFLYRAPWEVVDSLYRRGDAIFQESPHFALEIWLNYNRALMDFYDRCPEKSLLLNIEDIRLNREALSSAIAQKFGITLSIQPDIYDSSLFHAQISQSSYARLLQQFFPESVKLYEQLEARCDFQKRVCNREMFSNFDRDWLLQDWLQLRSPQEKQFQLQSKLEVLQQTERDLTQQLAQTKEALDEAKTQLAEKEGKIENLEGAIAAMESSKFWKMRQLWMRVKQHLPLL